MHSVIRKKSINMVKIQFICAVFVFAIITKVSSGFRIGEDPFIVGGEEVKDFSVFDHSLALFGPNDRYLCGASIIHIYFALTAAHCMPGSTPASMVKLKLNVIRSN